MRAIILANKKIFRGSGASEYYVELASEEAYGKVTIAECDD